MIVTLYHGTCTAHLPDILKNGIKPRGEGPGNWEHTVKSGCDRVYLSDCYAMYYAKVAADETGTDPVVIEVMVNAHMLVADEDALESMTRGGDGVEGDILERTKHYRDNARYYSHAVSLEALGTCAHLGFIPPELIKRIVKVTSPIVLHGLCDPTITRMNHYLLAGHYEDLTKFIFGDKPVSEAANVSPVEWGKIPRDGIEPVPLTFA